MVSKQSTLVPDHIVYKTHTIRPSGRGKSRAHSFNISALHSGFDKPVMTCCGYGGPPYNYDFNKGCQSKDVTACDDGAKFVSWDGVHITEAANAVVANKVFIIGNIGPNSKKNSNCFKKIS